MLSNRMNFNRFKPSFFFKDRHSACFGQYLSGTNSTYGFRILQAYFTSLSLRLKHFNIDPGAQIFLACSDTSRLRMLNLIMTNGEMCITDLEHILEFTQTKTSRHLIYLKNSGILTSRKFNQWIFYQIKDEVQDIIQQIFHFLRRDPVLQKDQYIFNNLYTNRELTLNKLKMKPLSHRS